MRLDYEGALAYFEASLRIDPKNAYTHSNKGNVLKELSLFLLALESYEKSIALDRGYAEAYNNKGNTLFLIDKFEDAVECYKKAIALNPSYADAYNGLGIVNSKKGNFTTAFESFEKARRLDPCSPSILSWSLSIRIKTCFWQHLTDILNQLYPLALKKGSKIHPFDFMALIDEPNALCNLTRQYVADLYPARDDLGELTKIPPREKIRIAYFSGDFINHPVSILMAGIIESHDHKKFEVYGFSYRLGEKTDEEMQARIAKSCHRFISISNRSDKEVAIMAREIGIDIAVDLGGLTEHNRPGVF
jgi:predicted O-linked N-acetylglucosamine transferase (SPINDLY family)